MTPVRVAVTGASGRLGRAVVEELATAGFSVRAIDRVPPGEGLTGESVVGDLRDAGVAREAVAGCDAVVHLAAWPSPHLAPRETVWGDNLALLSNVAFASAAGQAERFIYASSQSVLGLAWAEGVVPPDYLPVDEDHPCRPSDTYSASKLAGEHLTGALARGGAFAAVALRFPVVWDHRDFSAHVAKRLGDPPQGARSHWAYIDARDAARAVRLALEVTTEGFDVFNVVAPWRFGHATAEALVREWYPGLTDIRIALTPETALFDWRAAEHGLGFRARYRWAENGITEAP